MLARGVAHLDASLLLPLVAVVAVRAALAAAAGSVTVRAAATVKSGLRGVLLEHGARPGRGRRGGEQITLLTRGLDALDAFFTGYLPQVTAAGATPIILPGGMAAADWPSAVIIGVTLPLTPVFGGLVGPRPAELTRRQWGLLHRLGGHFRDV